MSGEEEEDSVIFVIGHHHKEANMTAHHLAKLLRCLMILLQLH